jgi:hypothetical protein
MPALLMRWCSGGEDITLLADDAAHAIGVAAYMCAPMFLVGLTGFYPNLWLDMLLGTLAAAYTIYLLYIGIPIVYDMPKERGFVADGADRFPVGDGIFTNFY